MDNFRNGGIGFQNQGTNTNQNTNGGGKNRNRKKKNKQQNQQTHQNNQNIPLSPSKTLINHYADYGGSMSLDHQSFSRPYNNKYPNNYNYNNQNNRNFNNSPTKFNKRRNGSQSNYYNGSYDNDRLNKSLTPNNSFGENTKISTSISLDNFDMVNNQKRSPITNTYSFLSSNVIINQKTSPYKNSAYPQQQTIIEHANLEEEMISEATNSLSIQEIEAKSNDIYPSITSTESLNTSGDFMVDDTPLSCYSTPLNHQSDSSRLVDPDESPKKNRENEESLNQNDKTPVKYDESEQTVKHEVKSDDSCGMSDSSPDSKNSDQNLVTASEGESSFNNENTVMHHHEHNLAKELEHIAHNFELPVDEADSNKSVNGSNESSSTESFSTTSNEIEKEEDKQEKMEEYKEENFQEQTQIEQILIEENQFKEQEIVQEEQKIDEAQPKEEVVQEHVQSEENHPLKEEVVQEQKIDEAQPEEEIVQQHVQSEENHPLKEEIVEIEQIVVEEPEQKLMEKIQEEEVKTEQKQEEAIPNELITTPEKIDEESKIEVENVEIKPIENTEILIPTSYEIRIRPQVEEIDLADEEPVVIESKQDDILNIAPVETEKEEEIKQDEVDVLNETVESIVDLSKMNTSVNQKEPVVDCFSCTIV